MINTEGVVKLLLDEELGAVRATRARAEAIARDRVAIGVHYPTDIHAGAAFADAFHSLLLRSEAYRRDVQRVGSLVTK